MRKRTSSRHIRLTVDGMVQGVGFRPFVYRLATELSQAGWVSNSPNGALIELEGDGDLQERFLLRLRQELPPHALISRLSIAALPLVRYQNFIIRPSHTEGAKSAFVSPDIATCPACVAELFDTTNRRYRYPFMSCTNCGPRFSIIESLPYDRSRITMKHFVLCGDCQAEYEDPASRRFHAQTNACPACGPRLELRDRQGKPLALCEEALQGAVRALRQGSIVAIKGIGGFQLLADAANGAALQRLRNAKRRPHKPFAVMAPSFTAAELLCEISTPEKWLLTSPAAPIVLLRRRERSITASDTRGSCPQTLDYSDKSLAEPVTAARPRLAANVAPDNPYLGVMLPYSPLHHLILNDYAAPLVATSGNLCSEPICIDNDDALTRLGGLADLFLVHDRPILRPLDDSVVRIVMGRELMLRRARGYVPLPIPMNRTPPAILALGGHLKSTVAVGARGQVILSQHLGDLDSVQANANYRRTIGDLTTLYEVRARQLVCDLHPDYASSQYGSTQALPVLEVQHHYAHVLSCMAEQGVEAPLLGIAWDGIGLGVDGELWGGEFLLLSRQNFKRFAHLRPFGLPGGARAVREPRRSALGLLYEMMGNYAFESIDLTPVKAFSARELPILKSMLEKRLNAPRCTSVGRLFDAIASLLGLCQIGSFEGQAAMTLEFAQERHETDLYYPFALTGSDPLVIDWQPMVSMLLDDLAESAPIDYMATKFHNTLAEMIVVIARNSGQRRVVLSGGSFQNRYLTEYSIERLREEGFEPHWHQHVPPNDGGLALGQILAVARRQEEI
jgi:hydrogenase maturation protein HypF